MADKEVNVRFLLHYRHIGDRTLSDDHQYSARITDKRAIGSLEKLIEENTAESFRDVVLALFAGPEEEDVDRAGTLYNTLVPAFIERKARMGWSQTVVEVDKIAVDKTILYVSDKCLNEFIERCGKAQAEAKA